MLPDYDESQVLEVTSRLRAQGHEPELVAAALTQARLRERARPRLGSVVDRLLFTPDGAEQATRPMVAARHAQHFVDAGVDHVWDLGCGLGLDSLALAQAGLRVTAVEKLEEVAVAATANLSTFPQVQVRHTGIEEVADQIDPSHGVWLDPARRTPGVADVQGRTRRLFRLDDLSPSWQQVQAWAAHARATGAKLSPGFPVAHLPPGTQAEWVSVDGSVVECVIWWGAAAQRPGRSAVMGRTLRADPAPAGTGRACLPSDTAYPPGQPGVEWVTLTPAEGETPDPLTDASELGPWLVEPDRAILAADLTSSAAALIDGQELDPGVGYVSTARSVEVPWGRRYAVQEVLPLHAKAVRSWCRTHDIQRLTLKKRGVPVDPDRFRAEVGLKARRKAGPGSTEATLVLTRLAGRPVAIVVE